MKKLSQISPSVVPQWEACEQCKPNGWVVAKGWVTGPPSMKRCPCVKAHAQRVADALKAQGKR